MQTFISRFAAAVLVSAGLLTVGPVSGAERTAIHFADLGNIRSWHSDSPNELFVQSMNRQWYRITFWSPCHELPFATGINFITDTLGDLNEFSSVLVNGERCWFRTFEESEAPPERAEGQEQ